MWSEQGDSKDEDPSAEPAQCVGQSRLLCGGTSTRKYGMVAQWSAGLPLNPLGAGSILILSTDIFSTVNAFVSPHN